MSALDDIITIYNVTSAAPLNGEDMQRVIDARAELAALRADALINSSVQLLRETIERQAKRIAELEQAVQSEAESVAEFNAGFDAQEDGTPYDNESETKHDQWRVGWAWAAFDALRESEKYWQEQAEAQRSEAAVQRERAEKYRFELEAARELIKKQYFGTYPMFSDRVDALKQWLDKYAPEEA